MGEPQCARVFLSKPSRRTILLVDDEPDGREALRVMLELEGFTVLEANNGQEALDLLVSAQDTTPNLIITDLQMPIMSGWEFLAMLKSYTRLVRIPVLILSGHPRHLDVDRHGAVHGRMVKPIEFAQLLVKVRAALQCA